jgi:glycine/D-amino acid oxidase-like deaminating enzyme
MADDQGNADGAYRNGEISYWMSSSRAQPTRSSLQSDERVDVAIVGGGLTGLWTAYYLSTLAPCLNVAVLESKQVGYGASGRNGGYLSHLTPGNRGRYASSAGHGAAIALQRAMIDGIDEVLGVCAEESIDADQVRGGNLIVATTSAGMNRLRHRRDADLRFGMAADESCLVSAAQTRARINASKAIGGLYYPMVTRIHPARLIAGLSAAVERRGVRIHEQTPALRVSGGTVYTPAAELRAKSVLICTEAYSGPLLGRRRIIPINSSMIVTRQLSDAEWRTIGWANEECLNDSAHVFMYAQRTADGRIAAGGRGSPYRFGSAIGATGVTPDKTVRELLGRLRTYFPSVDLQVEHAWSGVIGVTRDWCASVEYDAATGIGTAGGYAGHGVTTANLAARTLVDLVLGRESPLCRLPWVSYRSPNWEPEPLRWLGIHSMYRLFRMADEWEERRGSKKTSILARVGRSLAGLQE